MPHERACELWRRLAAKRDLDVGKLVAQDSQSALQRGFVAFLASDDARWLTGGTIRVDGGSML